MFTLHDLTIKKVHDGLLSKEFSALELAKEFFEYIAYKDKEVGAYLTLDKDGAYVMAEKTDIAIAKGEEIGVLSGVPLAVKDNMLIEGLPATAASKILENYRAAYDATVIEKLKKENAVFLGKTNLDEFAMGSSTENSAFGITKNPHDLKRVPGGSSGGSAAAVAAHMAVAALGSDTGGSIRQPASFCGVVGLKPTYGAVSRYGLIALASSLDQIGPLTKTVEDAAILFNAIRGKDEMDATSVDLNLESGIWNLEKVRKLKIGLPKEYFVAGLDKEVEKAVQNAIDSIKSLKIEFKEISLPHTKYALSCYYIIMPAEASANLARFDGIRYGSRAKKAENLPELYKKTRGEEFGAEARRRIILGTFVLSSGYYDAYYAKAQKVRRLIKNDFDETFKEVDIILTPVAPTPAFKIGEKTEDPLSMYLSDIFTIPVNLAGLPAISIPVKTELPVGFQLIGKPFCEADILSLGQFYEKISI
ncbi:aspartyl/glutamyl-tRNA amidotransferase subunit A [Candidatus Wolfebacteria bacterium RIFCSPLOWO2_01_FULL_45_19]|uniref:Glutamyl-tRNA(Gln) amidotransferase subunit A n=1 Tax=Candidatus Wolfebacteria bacterium RIFCSPLOWO2_01_FULL_45_19 TaxID=1802557 RepID=A0A1F8DRN5_9BACT|nr:MAG: aspartyl/glutamyl-tRNA amidotransferase subunit A [Candidatus Wolfebacteria bacterium RIFCSPLOWO2_01_FULL_45_19]